MQNANTIQAQYDAAKVLGRSDLDPRIGVYRILSVYNGTCFKRPAQIATTNWKKSPSDDYSDTIFEVQLETFKTGLNPLNTDIIVLREIQVTYADWHPEAPLFAVGWLLLPFTNPSIAQINELVSKNNFKIEFTDQDDLIESELNSHLDNLRDY